MKIKMQRSVAIRGGSYSSGKVVDAPEGVARSMVKAGHAVSLDPEAPTVREEPAAAESPAEESSEPDLKAEDPDEHHVEDGVEAEAEAEEDGYGDMSLAQLREAAKAQDLPTSGKKADLIARLRGQ